MKHTIVIAVIVLLGLVAQGCGHSTGGPAPADQANLIVDNTENHTMTIYIDERRLATVAEDSTETFYVVPGFHKVEVRYGNDLMPTYDRGTIEFMDPSAPGFRPVRLS